jgi:hypothetical protein
MPRHNHDVVQRINSEGGAITLLEQLMESGNVGSGNRNFLRTHSNTNPTRTPANPENGSHNSTIITTWTGGQGNTNTPSVGGAHENRPPFYGIYFIRKTSNVCP